MKVGNIYKFQDREPLPDNFFEYPSSLRDNRVPVIIDNGKCFGLYYNVLAVWKFWKNYQPKVDLQVVISAEWDGQLTKNPDWLSETWSRSPSCPKEKRCVDCCYGLNL